MQYLHENLAALSLLPRLAPSDVAAVRSLAEAAEKGNSLGDRYAEAGMKAVLVDTPPLKV